MIRATFTLDEPTMHQLRTAAERLRLPQSQVVRSAINDYARRIGRLSDEERIQLLRVFDSVVRRIRRRPRAAIQAEIREIRHARRRGGRRHTAA